MTTKDPVFNRHMTYSLSYSWNETDKEMVKKLHDLNMQWYGNLDRGNDTYLTGFAIGIWALETLKMSIETYGVDQLTGDNIRKLMESGKVIETGIGPPVKFKHWDHQLNMIRWVACQDGVMKPASEWLDIPLLTDEQREPDYWENLP